MTSAPTVARALAFLWSYWRRSPRVLAATAACLGLFYAGMIFVPVLAGRLVDAVSGGSYERAARALLVLVLAMAGAQVARRGAFYFWIKLATDVMKSIVAEAFHRVQRFSTAWHAEHFAGTTVRQITRGMWAYDMLADTFFFGIVPTSAMLVGLSAMLSLQWWLMGVVFALMAGAHVALTVYLSLTYVGPYMEAHAEADSRLGGQIADAVTCNAVVKSFGAEAREDARLGEAAELWRRRASAAWNRGTHLGGLQSAMQILMLASLLGLALVLWGRGLASPGAVGVALTTYLVMEGYLRDIGMHIDRLQKSVSEIADLVDFSRTEPGIADAPGARELRVTDGAIRFEHVGFHYGDHARPLFAGLDLDIAPGERLALVGQSGSGKSTFVRLVQRLFEVSEGRVLIDGQDISRVTLESLRQAIALVPQDPVLFHRSLAENIAYARPQASRDDIEAAARRAHAHDFIAAMPEGYATLVGERGVRLSGGERQRIAIARAFLADAPILILDEATSSLDSLTERDIQEALQALMAGRTTIIIAHRLSTVRRADRILVFERGRIVEEGSHGALMQREGGVYRRLHETQSLGLVAEAAR